MNSIPNADFSAKLLPLLSDKENSIISPYGIESVLSMVEIGASEEVIDEIVSSLGVLNAGELAAVILPEMDIQCDAFKIENEITFIKGNDNVELLEHFKKMMTNIYYAKIIEKRYNGESVLQLNNTAIFKAEWLYETERFTDKDYSFTNVDDSRCHPVFLRCTEKLNCYKSKDSNIKAVAIPYKYDGTKIPYELVLVDSEKPLTALLIDEIFSNMSIEKCEVIFPEFEIKSEFDLIPMMKKLGLNALFDSKKRSLTNIATKEMHAGDFMQKAEIRVDKYGTVAQAFTFMYCYLEGGVDLFTYKFDFSNPFTYFLRNTLSGEILFMGKVNRLKDVECRKFIFGNTKD